MILAALVGQGREIGEAIAALLDRLGVDQRRRGSTPALPPVVSSMRRPAV
jgi:hypothetical protein